MKKLLVLIATCVLFANAQEIRADGVYTGISGGLNWVEDYHHASDSVDLDTGYTGVGTIGYRWDCGLRLEGEVGYKYNRIAKVKSERENLHIRGHVNTWSTMANVLYHLPVDFCVSPYVGAGAGYAKSTAHAKHLPTGVKGKGSVDGFTHQFLAGLEYPLNDCLSLDTKYRYQKTQHLNHNQSVEVGLVYAF